MPASSASIEEWRDWTPERTSLKAVENVGVEPENDRANLQEPVAHNPVDDADTSMETDPLKQDNKQQTERKRKSVSKVRDYPPSSRKKRNSDEVSELYKIESDTIDTIAPILCVSSGSPKKTPKFVIAVALGKEIVTEQWLVQCHCESMLLDHTQFISKDEEREREWNFDLQTAIKKGKQGMSDRLEGAKVYYTRQLKMDLRRMAVILGADDQGVSLPIEKDGRNVVIIGVNSDPEAASVKELGYQLYTRGLLILGTLRGVLDLDLDEFLIELPIKSQDA